MTVEIEPLAKAFFFIGEKKSKERGEIASIISGK